MTSKELEKMADKLLEGSEGILTKSRLQTIKHNELYYGHLGSGTTEEDNLHTSFSNVGYLLHPCRKMRSVKRKAKETNAERELREQAEAATNPKVANALWMNYWNSEIRHFPWRAINAHHSAFYTNGSLCNHWGNGNILQLEPVVIKELLKMDLDSVRETEVGRELEQIVKDNCTKKQKIAFYAKLCGYKNKDIENLGVGWSVKTVDYFFNHGLLKLVEKALKKQKEQNSDDKALTLFCCCCKRELPVKAFYSSVKNICKECKRKKAKERGGDDGKSK